LERGRKRYEKRDGVGHIHWGNRRDGDDRDMEFLEEAAGFAGKPIDIPGYARWFRFKGDRLSGDISPSYITMDEEAVARVARDLPDTKIVLMVREPVARGASQISLAYRSGRFEPAMMDDAEGFRAWLRESKTLGPQAFPTALVERWKTNAPDIDFRWFLFDEIEQRPDEARRNIIAHLGGDPDKASEGVAPGHNRKATSEKLPLTDMAREILIEHFADEIRACAKLFNGAASEWGARYGL
jgi:hypothetical protein